MAQLNRHRYYQKFADQVSIGYVPKVDETTLSQKDEMAAVLHGVTVNLRLDVRDGLSVSLEPSNVDLDVEVADAGRCVSEGPADAETKHTWRR